MVPLRVVMSHKLDDDALEMAFAKHKQVIQTLLFD
jgi:hypothetical protein